MSDTLNHGGPAFPRSAFTPGSSFHNNAAEAGFASTARDGMSLRDYFAAAALQGMLADPNNAANAEANAIAAYKFADAMITQRAKETKP